MNTTRNRTAQSVYPAIRYLDAAAGIAWLTSALGFEEHEVYKGKDGSIEHAELSINGNLIMLGTSRHDSSGKSPRELGGVTGTIYIALDSPAAVDALFARATAAGADIVRKPVDTDYGSREFGVVDPEGHGWSFGTYQPQANG